jgi:hypothetical protein
VNDQGGDYIAFRDSVIVALADDQVPPGLGDLELTDLCRRHGIAFSETWITTVGADMEVLGWGRDRSTLKERRFLINGAGLARAAEVRKARKPVTVRERVRKVPVAKGLWDLFKIGLGVVLGVLATRYFGQS